MTLPGPDARTSPDNAEHFEGLKAGLLMLPRCDRCQAVIWYPRHFCPACGSLEVSWFQASGRGTVHSFSVIRKGPGQYAEVGPYVLAYVELEEGPRVLTNLVDEPETVEIGLPVEAVIEADDGGLPILRFRISR